MTNLSTGKSGAISGRLENETAIQNDRLPDLAHESPAPSTPRTPRAPRARRSPSLVHKLVDEISQQIRAQILRAGDKLPTESQIMQAHGVSRTIVREALSRMQAAGQVETHHGIGTFVLEVPTSTRFRISPADIVTATDVLALMELRISLEIESAGLAAQRRNDTDLQEMRAALDLFEANVNDVSDTVAPDFRFHMAIANATGNRYFADILSHVGTTLIARLSMYTAKLSAEAPEHLRRVNRQHEDIYDAIVRRDAEYARAAMRIHLTNSRERMLHEPGQGAATGQSPDSSAR